MVKIEKIAAIEILDSRGNWTVETNLTLTGNYHGSCQIPSGLSTGSYEKKTIPAKAAVEIINQVVAPKIKGLDFDSVEKFDAYLLDLDDSDDRGNLGANSLLSLSVAFTKALASSSALPLYGFLNQIFLKSPIDHFPQPIFNVVNGGAHAQNDLDFQEFLLLPRGQQTFDTSLAAAVKTFHILERLLLENGLGTDVGDEGGFSPHNISPEAVLNFIVKAGEKNKLLAGKDFFLGLDVAASQLMVGDLYHLARQNLKATPKQLQEIYLDLCQKFPIVYLEDPFGQDQASDFALLKRAVGQRVEIVGDDLVASDLERLKQAVKQKAINAVIIKPIQIGTVSETLKVADFALRNQIATVVSHRSGETEDTFIADLAVGIGAKYFKAGAPARGERVAKYNRLLEIEQELSNS